MAAPRFEEMVDTKFLMEHIGFSRNFWITAREKYKLPFYRLGRNTKYRLSEVEQWLKERKQNA